MKTLTTFLSILLIVGTACNSGNQSGEQESGKQEEMDTTAMSKQEKEEQESKHSGFPMEKNGLKVSKVQSMDFPDASLDLKQPKESAELESGKVKFDFEVGNYELKKQTEDAEEHMLANSSKGQHIHVILNNGPYDARYNADFEKELEDGHYVALAFLSRSYHESVKNEDAYVLKQFTVGDAEMKDVDFSSPHMFYSRPKGTYSGKDAGKILLDFYLVNTDLSKDGNTVKATINDTDFEFHKWQPYAVEGFESDTVNIKLELVDGDGNQIESPFNPVQREIVRKPDMES